MAFWTSIDNTVSITDESGTRSVQFPEAVVYLSHDGEYAASTININWKPTDAAWELPVKVWKMGEREPELVNTFMLPYKVGKYHWIQSPGVMLEWNPVKNILCATWPSSYVEGKAVVLYNAETDNFVELTPDQYPYNAQGAAWDFTGNLVTATLLHAKAILDPTTLKPALVSSMRPIWNDNDSALAAGGALVANGGMHKNVLITALTSYELEDASAISAEFSYGESHPELTMAIYTVEGSRMRKGIMNIRRGESLDTIIDVLSASVSPDLTKIAAIKANQLQILDLESMEWTQHDNPEIEFDDVLWNRNGKSIIVANGMYSSAGVFIKELPKYTVRGFIQ
jgi:hypothetical protein